MRLSVPESDFSNTDTNEKRATWYGDHRLHDYHADGSVVETALKLWAAEPRSLRDSPVSISDGELEYVFCQIHSDSRSIHRGLLSGCADSDTTLGQLAQ
jgi:hypothetical protein